MKQLVKEPTREENILDLYATNRPGLVTSVQTIPGFADHHTVIVDSDIKLRLSKKPRRTVYQWSKATWDTLKEKTMKFQQDFLQTYAGRDVDSNYSAFCSHVENIMKDIPSKLSKSRRDVPWMTTRVKRLCRKKQRIFNKAKRTKKEQHWTQYRQLKKTTEKALKTARWDYINNILQTSLDEGNTKPFWRHIYSQRMERSGVAPLKEKGTLFSGSQDKAEILNRQFTSVFTPEEPDCETTVSGPSYPPLKDLVINVKGVEKLLTTIQPNKAAGPDQIPCRILKELAPELAPVLTAIFTQSLQTGQIPSKWSTANVSPVFKKGQTCLPGNYRPISLTCVPCKLMEHIICHHIRDHLDKHGILSPFQHGFRAKYSCETQLVTTLHDLLRTRDLGVQLDVAILDFSKAFDKVPHRRLLNKLQLYGISGPTHNWIRAFLTGRTQSVVVEGSKSISSPVTSGVPQGSVLGPLLFLLFINDLPSVLDPATRCRLFADDCVVYRNIRTIEDQIQLQRDLYALETWGTQWGMSFNADKCNIMTIARQTTPHVYLYQLNNQVLKHVNDCKYLGITISADLSWETHVNTTAKKANSRLGFLKRNLKGSPKRLKQTAFITLTRSLLEYGMATWDPHLQKDIDTLERIQRRAARWIERDYRPTTSVTEMLENLSLDPLADRREAARLILMFKIMHNHVSIPPDDLDLQPASQRTRSSHRKKLQHLRASTEAYRNSFATRTIPIWNTLPAHVAEADSIEAFKSQLAAQALP